MAVAILRFVVVVVVVFASATVTVAPLSSVTVLVVVVTRDHCCCRDSFYRSSVNIQYYCHRMNLLLLLMTSDFDKSYVSLKT